MKVARLELLAIPGLPMIKAGDDLAALIAEGFLRGGLKPQAGDVLGRRRAARMNVARLVLDLVEDPAHQTVALGSS